MTEAVDVLHAIERLTSLVGAQPEPDPAALQSARDVLRSMGWGKGTTGYKAEKLAAVGEDFVTWFGTPDPAAASHDPNAFRTRMLQDIEHLKKALARGSEGQD
jgi:hypothetical protein